jgi:hypothetical protein
METCKDLKRRATEMAATRPEDLPEAMTRHLTGCPACTRVLAQERLARGLLTMAAKGPEPPAGFAETVLSALSRLPVPLRLETELWRPAWGLVPAFAATVAALLFLFQTSSAPGPSGFLPTESFSAGEQLVLESPAPNLDLVLAAVLEQGE